MSHNKIGILVAGMHRSGTSAITRVINLLGADLPGNLVPPADGDNSTGFWESVEIPTIHDDFLAGLNLDYDSPTVLPNNWQELSIAKESKNRITEFINREFLNSNIFVIKDPRICRFLPLWFEIFQENDIKPVVVLPLRHPYEVGASLKKRNAIPNNRGVLLWLFHVLEAEVNSRQYPRSFILFNELLDNWQKSLGHLMSLPLFASRWPNNSAEISHSISKFLAPDLKHHDANAENKIHIKNAEQLLQLAEIAYDNLKRLVGNPSDEHAQNSLDEVRMKLLSSDKLYASFVTNHMDEAALDKSIFKLGDTIHWLNKERADYEATLNKWRLDLQQLLEFKQGQRIKDLKKDIIEKNSELISLQLQNDELRLENDELGMKNEELSSSLIEKNKSLDREIENTNNIRGQLDEFIFLLNSYQNSSAWKLSIPLRWLEQRVPKLLSSVVTLNKGIFWGLSKQRRQRMAFRRNAIRLLSSQLFDEPWYITKYPHVVIQNCNALKHWLLTGWQEGYDPNQLFDTKWYLEKNPDVLGSGVDPLTHFLETGSEHGCNPNPLFDVSWYLEKYSEVIPPEMNPLAHYLSFWKSGFNPNSVFDTSWYVKNNPDLAATEYNPLAHYLHHGGKEGRSPSQSFDTTAYLLSHPEIVKSGVNPLVHYFTQTPNYDEAHPSYIESAEQAVADLSLLDPELMAAVSPNEIKSLPRNIMPHKTPLTIAWSKIMKSLTRTYDRMVFVPWLSLGGADLVAIMIIKAVQERYGIDSVLLVVTDFDKMAAAHWLPEGTHSLILSDFNSDLSHDDRVTIVTRLIWAMQPKAVLNNNSRALWDAIVRRGEALTQVTSLYATLFCRDYLPDGRSGGYSNLYFRKCIPYLTKVYVDNQGFVNDLTHEFGLTRKDGKRLSVLYQPSTILKDSERMFDFSLHPNRSTNFHILWAGRFCRQKNVELLIEIASKYSHATFDVYGAGEDHYTELLRKNATSNIVLHGQFSKFDELPLESYDVLLYTSLWDGLPYVLIDAAACQIPIVASAVGGISELVDDSTGWIVKNYRDAEGYIEQLEYIRTHPEETTKRVSSMKARVEMQHSWKSYTKALEKMPSFLVGE